MILQVATMEPSHWDSRRKFPRPPPGSDPIHCPNLGPSQQHIIPPGYQRAGGPPLEGPPPPPAATGMLQGLALSAGGQGSAPPPPGPPPPPPQSQPQLWEPYWSAPPQTTVPLTGEYGGVQVNVTIGVLIYSTLKLNFFKHL